MIVIACGGRDFADSGLVTGALDALHRKDPISVLLHGGAKGADHLASVWARAAGIDVITHNANWDKHGKAAGPIRNSEMLRSAISIGAQLCEQIGVVAFPGGRGTTDMKSQAEKSQIKVWEPRS